MYSEAFEPLAQTVKRAAVKLDQPKEPVSMNIEQCKSRPGFLDAMVLNIWIHLDTAVDSRLLVNS